MIDLVFDGMVAFSIVASVMLGAIPIFKYSECWAIAHKETK